MFPFLPDPLWFDGALVACGLALVASFWLPLLPKRLIIEAMVVLGVASYVATGYEYKEREKLMPQIAALKDRIASDEARAESFRQDIIELRKQAAAKQRVKVVKVEAAATKAKEELRAQDPAVTAVSVPAAAGVFVNRLVAATNSAVFGPEAGADAQAAADAAPSSNVGDWERWAAEVVPYCGELITEVQRLREERNGEHDAAVKADAAHPATPVDASPVLVGAPSTPAPQP